MPGGGVWKPRRATASAAEACELLRPAAGQGLVPEPRFRAARLFCLLLPHASVSLFWPRSAAASGLQPSRLGGRARPEPLAQAGKIFCYAPSSVQKVACFPLAEA